jgi:hypothetical protein
VVEGEEGEEGLYVVDLKEGVLRHVDSEQNTFTLPLHGQVTTELAGIKHTLNRLFEDSMC